MKMIIVQAFYVASTLMALFD